MNIAARRRLAVGVVATTSALVAGLLIAPAMAAPNGLSISPAGAFNSDPTADLTFRTTDADLNFGGEATFSRQNGGTPFVVEIDSNAPLFEPEEDREATQTVDFTDMGDGLGNDGPADAGIYNVVITGNENEIPGSPVPSTGGGTDSCTTCFTVLPGGPLAVTSVAPTSLRPGQTGDVSILGNNFERGTRIEVLFPGGGVDSAINANLAPTPPENTAPEDHDGVTTRTELKRRIAVSAAATAGARDVRVTNLDGASAVCESCFFVAGAELTSTNPTFGANDPNSSLVTVTFSSTSQIADGEPRLEFLGNPGAVPRSELLLEGQNPRNFTGTSITADYSLANAAPGNYQPVVVGDNGVVHACRPGCIFSVDQRDERAPTLTSLDRSTLVGTQKSLRQGETAEFVARGTNFSMGATLVFTPAEGLTVSDVDFVSPEELVVTITAAADAATGDRDVQARLTDGTTSAICDNCITVTAGTGGSPAPTPTASSSPQPGNEEFDLVRFAGRDRYETAARVATGSYTSAATVIIANGESDNKATAKNEEHFPDALAAAYLAGNRQAPTLLVTENTLPTPTRDAIRSLQTSNVVIIGGTSAVSTKVEQELDALVSGSVTRIAGTNRYETAQRVAETPAVSYVGENPDGARTAVVASGERFADALVAGPLGYSAKFPVLITAGASLSTQTRAALENLDIEHVLIPGGEAVVSQQTENQIRSLGITTRRFAGTGRTETAVMVAAYAYDELEFDDAHVDLARGDQFPDALAGGPHSGTKRAPILLTQTSDEIGKATDQFLRSRGSELGDGHIFGGTSAVSTRAEQQAETAVRQGTATSSPSPSASPSGSASPSASASPTTSASPTASVSPSPTGSASPTAAAGSEEPCATAPLCPF